MRETVGQLDVASTGNWKTVRIGSVFEMQLGKMLSKAAKTGRNSRYYLANRNVQWDRADVSALEMMDFSAAEQEKFSLRPGDLLVCEGGEVGRTCMWRGELMDCFFQKAIHRLRPTTSDVLPEYMLHLMRLLSDTGAFTAFTSQSSIAHLTREKLALVQIYVPPLPQQRKIARILTTLDNVIAQTEALIAKYQAIKQGLMHDLFTRGVDATGKLRPPQSEAPELYKQSDLGWIPKEWEINELGSTCTWMSGGTPSKSNPEFWTGEIPWVSPKDMKKFEIGDSEDHISEDAARIGTRFVPAGTVLIVIRGMILAHSFPVCVTTRPVTFNQDIKALVFNGKVDGRFLAYWLVSKASAMIALATESTHGTKRYDMDDLQSVAFAIPSPLEQTAIVSRLDSLANSTRNEQEQLKKLQTLKTGLMQDLLTGKVRVTVEVGMENDEKGEMKNGE